MEEEFELTYLAKTLPEGVLTSPSNKMLDIYLPTNAPYVNLRIRSSGDRYEITKKSPVDMSDVSHQMENTIPLTKEEFEDLSQITGQRVSKTRYYYKEDGVTYEIDIFSGDLVGLVLVDVEFKDREEMSAFVAPSWVLLEVTQRGFIAGGALSGSKYEDIESRLEELNYKKIEI